MGNAAQLREDARAAWIRPWLESVAQDVRYGFRSLRRQPGFTLAVALSLAVGIGANTCVFTLAFDVRDDARASGGSIGLSVLFAQPLNILMAIVGVVLLLTLGLAMAYRAEAVLKTGHGWDYCVRGGVLRRFSNSVTRVSMVAIRALNAAWFPSVYAKRCWFDSAKV